jgi:hypothetical protein
MKFHRYILYFTLLVLPFNQVVAQDESDYYGENYEEEAYLSESIEPRDYEKKGWEKITEGLDYQVEKPKEKKKSKPKPPNSGPDLAWMGPYIAAFFKILAVVAVVLLLGFILRSYFLAPKNRQVDAIELDAITLDNLEENLEQAELAPFLQRSLSQQDYQVAVRLYYLDALKQLSQRRMIFWRKNKTNRDYLREMLGQKEQPTFQELTLIFERVRYGELQLSEYEFALIEPQFQAFLQAIKRIPVPLNSSLA